MAKFRVSRREFTTRAAAGMTAIAAAQRCRSAPANPPRRKNVLFIAVDDLRPELGCFGRSQIHSPHIDELASRSTVFDRCYCQVPVCGASRASLLTGVRPTRTRFVGYDTMADKDAPGVVSLPRHFKAKGYHTASRGKIYHHLRDGQGSWSESPWRPKTGPDGNWRDYWTQEGLAAAARNSGAGPPYECGDVTDSTYADGKIADKIIADLTSLASGDTPFFLAAGFLKPHLPFNAPKRYWDRYDPEKIDLADNPFSPKGAPRAALHNWGELRAYAGIPRKGPLNDDMARRLIHGYYACVSYTDAQIGRVLEALRTCGLEQDTIVVLWGDHGWNLGEHGLWCKHCNFETSLRSPLIMRAPGTTNGTTCHALTEFVDIYPTLCELAGLPVPSHTAGTSLVPLLTSPHRPWKRAVYSRYYSGDSIRTDRYRYTEWTNQQGHETARMLYDHDLDPGENVNIAEYPENAPLVARLSRMCAAHRGDKS